VLIDPHTADGLGVALRLRQPGETVVVLETAKPAKFAQTIHEAVGREPDRPAWLADIESLPRRFTSVDVDVAALKRFIAEHA
jgi:threonine synthase